jgi:molybdopterin-guanine dinucleotide biosynthesis protein A
VLLELLKVAVEAPVEAVVLADGEGFRPLPAVLRVESARDAAHALLDSGRRRLRDLLDALRVAIVDEATWHALDPERRTLFDVDEAADLD